MIARKRMFNMLKKLITKQNMYKKANIIIISIIKVNLKIQTVNNNLFQKVKMIYNYLKKDH